MKTSLFYLAAILSAGVLGLTACGPDLDNEEQLRQEQRLLDGYLQQNNITVEPTESGLYYIPIVETEDRKPDFESFTDIRYIGRLIDGSVFESNIESVSKEYGIYDEDIVYGLTRLYIPFVTVEGFKEGLQMMSVGDSARLIVPSKIGFGGASLPGIPPYSTLIYDIKLLNEFKDPSINQWQEIADYLGGFDDLADSTAEGVFYEVLAEGTGDSIGSMSTAIVYIWYDAYFLDGRKWETNRDETSAQMVTYPEDDEALPGIILTLQYMRSGTKARVVVPYRQGFGANGYTDELDRTIVPYYTPLLYEIHVVKVE